MTLEERIEELERNQDLIIETLKEHLKGIQLLKQALERITDDT